MVDIEQLRAAQERFTANWHSGDFGLVADAVRELLALKENGQTVWWCEEHSQSTKMRGFRCDTRFDGSTCRMVEAVLHIHREGTTEKRCGYES